MAVLICVAAANKGRALAHAAAEVHMRSAEAGVQHKHCPGQGCRRERGMEPGAAASMR